VESGDLIFRHLAARATSARTRNLAPQPLDSGLARRPGIAANILTSCACGIIAAPMIKTATTRIVRRRRSFAARAVIGV
jgi:hypothetical protein